MFRTFNKIICVFDNKTFNTFYVKQDEFKQASNLVNRDTLIQTLKKYENKSFQRKTIHFENSLHDCFQEIHKYNSKYRTSPFFYDRFTIDWDETRKLNTKN